MKISTGFLVFIFLIFVAKVNAHSGRTDSYGCHNCRVGACAGEYHCHNGGSGVEYASATPILTRPNNPITSGSPSIKQSNEAPFFDIDFSWTNLDSKHISIALSKSPGADPGPNSDTTGSSFSFHKVISGNWYINMKVGVGSQWSDVRYWAIDVPKYSYPTNTPTPTLTPIPPSPTETPIPTPLPDPKTIEGARVTLGINKNMSIFQRSILFFKLLFGED